MASFGVVLWIFYSNRAKLIKFSLTLKLLYISKPNIVKGVIKLVSTFGVGGKIFLVDRALE